MGGVADVYVRKMLFFFSHCGTMTMRFRWDNSRSREGSSLCLKASIAMNVYGIMQLHSFVKSHIENGRNLCAGGCICTIVYFNT